MADDAVPVADADHGRRLPAWMRRTLYGALALLVLPTLVVLVAALLDTLV